MRKGLYLIVLFIIFLIFSAALKTPQEPELVANEILVKFKKGASMQTISSTLAVLRATEVRYIPEIGIRQMKLADGISVRETIDQLSRLPHVEYAEPNFIYHALVRPNDPHFDRQWALENTGQSGGLSGADISATQAWNFTTGNGSVLVGIIDSGIDFTHTDLRENIFINSGEDAWKDPLNPGTGNGEDDDGNGHIDDWKGWNFIEKNNDPHDDNGHGTHCAGIIGAVGNNAVGMTGVCWRVKILPLKFLDRLGDGNTADAVAAITYATKMGIHILNNSWGGGDFSNALLDAIRYAQEKGVLFVAAAGNDGLNTDIYPNYPASYDLDNIISVAASDHGDQRAIWGSGDDDGYDDCGIACNPIMAAAPGSNYGPKSVDVAAPGKDIYSTLPGGYGIMSGTSMAAPVVSGTAVLMLAKNAALTQLQIKERLLNSVDQVAAFQGLVISGGRINANNALQGL